MHMLSNNECKSALQDVSFPSRDLVSLSLFLYVWLYTEVSRNLGQRLLILHKCPIYLRRHNFNGNNILKIIYLFIEHWHFACIYTCLCEGVRYSGTRVTTDSCKLSCGCCELNPGTLKEQPVL